MRLLQFATRLSRNLLCIGFLGIHCMGGQVAPPPTFFIAPAGVDGAGCGSSGQPCASPNGVAANNSLACGDVIQAAAGTYTQAHMLITATPSCPAQNNAAWIECATPFACHATTQIDIEASYWGVLGWSNTSASQACFLAEPPTNGQIGTIAFVDNIASTCALGGIVYFQNGTGGVGNTIEIGNIVYNGITGTLGCDTGITHGDMLNFLGSGDQLYTAYNISYDNSTHGASCNGGGNADRTGINWDTMQNYTGQVVAENNWTFGNDGPGFELTSGGSVKNAGPVLLRYNTAINNAQASNQVPAAAEEYLLNIIGVGALQVTAEFNIGQGNSTIAGSGGAFVNAMYVAPKDVSPASLFDDNGMFESNNSCGFTGCGMRISGPTAEWNCLSPHTSPVGPFTSQYVGTGNAIGCSGSINTTSPAVGSTADPGAPSCGSAASTLACFATIIANWAPTAVGMTTWGANTAAPTDGFNTTAFVCNAMDAARAYAPSLFVTGGGPIPNRC